MKPLSEKEWKDILYRELMDSCWDMNGITAQEIAEDIAQRILTDRKAWGEYVIGEDIDFPRDSQTGAPVGTDGFIGLGKSELRARQRQRNQGEKD